MPIHLAFRLSRRRAGLAVVAALALATTALPATAQQAYPNRPITLVHPYAAGGSADSLARGLAHQLEQRLGQPVVVTAKPGGAAAIGTSSVARAAGDGYSLLLGTSAGHVVTPLMQKVAYDGVEDFAFIAVVANQPNVLIVNPALGIDSFQALVAQIKADPGKFNFASAGTGGATHLGAEAIWQRAGVRLTHVPYAGAAPALKDLVGGQVQIAMLNVSPTLPLIEAGRVKPLAYGGAKRSPLLPDVPTLNELGYGGTEVSTWYTLAAPKGTPREIVEALSKTLAEINADPAYKKLLSSQAAEWMDLSPADTTEFVRRDKAAMTKLLGALNLATQ